MDLYWKYCNFRLDQIHGNHPFNLNPVRLCNTCSRDGSVLEAPLARKLDLEEVY